MKPVLERVHMEPGERKNVGNRLLLLYLTFVLDALHLARTFKRRYLWPTRLHKQLTDGFTTKLVEQIYR
jgi:hypothetical protein